MQDESDLVVRHLTKYSKNLTKYGKLFQTKETLYQAELPRQQGKLYTVLIMSFGITLKNISKNRIGKVVLDVDYLYAKQYYQSP